jgi:hypothetical protein
MSEDDLSIAYCMVKNFKKYDTESNPPRINKLEYSVPKISGISKHEHGKNIDEVYPSTLAYILYHLHGSDAIRTTDALVALLYYWQFRKRNLHMMEKAYQEIVSHYTVQNKPYTYYAKSKMGKCVYLVKLSIGSKVLYKVGVTEDVHSRFKNLQSDIQNSYQLVSVGLEPINAVFVDSADEVEGFILEQANKTITTKHKFNFRGSTESFDDTQLIVIFNEHTSKIV